MKAKSFFITLSFVLLFCLFIFAKESQAAGSADVSWVAPTEDADGGDLTGLVGYKVFYDTESHWASECPTDVGTIVDVPGGEVASYFIPNTLEPGLRHYFAVVAYDEAGNTSDCATTESLTTEYSKIVTYSGDINNDHAVDISDFGILAGKFGNEICFANDKTDTNSDCLVDISDFGILAADFGKSF